MCVRNKALAFKPFILMWIWEVISFHFSKKSPVKHGFNFWCFALKLHTIQCKRSVQMDVECTYIASKLEWNSQWKKLDFLWWYLLVSDLAIQPPFAHFDPDLYRRLFLRKEQNSFPHLRGTLTSKIAMREIPDPKSTMGEWYNIKSFPVFKKTGKLFPCFWGKITPCFFAISEHFSTMREIISLFLRENHSLFFCYIGTFLY